MSAIDNKQLKAAQAEAATATDTYTHVFKKPFTYEDKTYEQLTLDFGSLTGATSWRLTVRCASVKGVCPLCRCTTPVS